MQNYKHYITGSLLFGISTGVISLLARWITGYSVLFSPAVLLKYGLIGGIGYSLLHALALFLFGSLGHHIRERFPKFETIGDLFKNRLKKDGYLIMSFLILILGLDTLFIQAMGAAVLFHFLLDIPIVFSLTFFFLYCFLIAGVGGMKIIQKFEGITLLFIFSAIIMIPMYFLIQEGVYPIYDGIRLYHPYLLFQSNNDTKLFILVAVLITFGKVLTDRSTWQRLYMIEKQKVRMTFWFTALILSTIPIGLSAMLFIIISGQSFDNVHSLLFQLLIKINPILLAIIFFLFCFGSIATTVKAELHATTIHFIKHIRFSVFGSTTDKKMIRESYLFSGILLLILLIIAQFLEVNILKLLFFYGQLYAITIPIMLILIVSKRKISRLLPYSVLFGWICGSFIFTNLGSLESVWISFITSSVFAVGSMFFATREISPSHFESN